ncbi:carbon-nitrogen hydrolase family protein [Streptomyces sp. NPDC059382]|uniref:carbon-nitrogen hydrolase family protein n=1 Tax=Streptomyces sp. NPDC059382 TaxID=3346816 RepID=UPI0036832245
MKRSGLPEGDRCGTLRPAVAQSIVPENPTDSENLPTWPGNRACGWFGSIHPLTPPNRPHNSLYVVSHAGALVTRYDKRYLSHTGLSYLYTTGNAPLVFEVDGIRFGTALCTETDFPEVFAQYERMDVDCVLISIMVDDTARAALAQAHATLHNYWVGYSVPAQFGATAPATGVAPGGRQLARCHPGTRPGLAIADIDPTSQDSDIDIALRHARPWRRTARAGLYDLHIVAADPRGDVRTRL